MTNVFNFTIKPQFLEASFIDFFHKFKSLRPTDLYDIYKITSIKNYKAGEIIAEEEQVFIYGLGIIKGVIRTYLLQSNGEEKTVRLSKEGDFAGCANCVLKEEPSFEYLQAVEDCKVIQVNLQEFKKLADKNSRLLKFWNKNISEILNEAIHRIQFFVSLTPEERYKQLLKENPEMINRVPQKYLASYIGVTTVSLSRIRARVKSF